MNADGNNVKKSCKAALVGYVTFTEVGKVDKNCQAVQDGLIVLNKDGMVSKNCVASKASKAYH
jgi:hypothetical protein